MRRLTFIVSLAITAYACTTTGPDSESRPQKSLEPKPAAKKPPPPVEEAPTTAADPEQPEGELGPLPSGVGKEDRTKAVLAILAGGAQAERLPLLDTDPNTEFDDHLVEKLQPRAPALPALAAPRVRQAKAQIEGSLDKDVIRRVVRSRIREVRKCYDQGLAEDPTLGGKVTIEFVIAPNGRVSSSKVGDATLGDKQVTTCIAKAARRWKFPKPPDDNPVNVSYPFALNPG